MADELLALADAERTQGRGAEAARRYDEAATAARAADDHDALVRAALGAASVQVFGAEPGRLPSLLYDVLARTTDDAQRSRLAAALARCWVYAGEADRALPFGDEAVSRARPVGDAALLADALDAALAAHWGPDDLDVRRDLTRELADVVAHVPDPEARLQAHLWGLHVACEALDVQAMHRQMRALELLGEESPRAEFFAASRRVMLDLLRGRTDTADRLLEVAGAAAERAFIPDGWLVLSALRAYAAIQAGDTATVLAGAAGAEEFGLAEGSTVVCAEAAYCWAAGGDVGRARALASTFGGVLAGLPRDVNWLLTLQCVLEAALFVGDVALVEEASTLLLPYAGRAVVNAGAVMFHGSTDDTLARALALLGQDQQAAVLRGRALATYERIGAQWWRDRLLRTMPVRGPVTGPMNGPADELVPAHLHPATAGFWAVGRDASPVPELRGLGYLRELVSRPWEQVAVLDLVGARGPVVEEAGLGQLADDRALADYRRRLRELDAELDEATEWADAGRVQVAQDERDALLAELGRVAGLGGRPRVTGSSQERARVAVRKAIAFAIDRIGSVDPAVGEHLRGSIRTGLSCSYEPAPGEQVAWLLS